MPPNALQISQFSTQAAQREIILWTTKDGREIPLDQMSDDHIASAVRVLSLWRSNARKKDVTNPIVRQLGEAIDRFKRIQRQRRKSAGRNVDKPQKSLGLRRS